jgi:hypothetical protein
MSRAGTCGRFPGSRSGDLLELLDEKRLEVVVGEMSWMKIPITAPIVPDGRIGLSPQKKIAALVEFRRLARNPAAMNKMHREAGF